VSSARWLVVACAVALAPACDNDEDSLEGSVSEFYPLAFESVRARLYDSELAIEYVREDGETVVRVTVRRDEKDPQGPGSIDLAAVGDLTGSAGGVELPPFADGRLVLEAYRPRDRARVAGRFEARVASGDARLSVRGTFATRLELVEGL
jgi:hypothetical protein